MVYIYRIILSIIFLTFGISKNIQVIDGISGKPIPFTQIKYFDKTTSSITNKNGVIEITENKSIHIIKSGFHSKVFTPPFPNKIRIYPIVFQFDKIIVTDTLINPHYELTHPLQIHKIEIESISSQNISHAFNEFPGMVIKSYGGIGSVKTLSLNGGQGDRIQVLFNGISINNEQSGNADISQIPIGLLNRIQFIPTGSSSRFGNSAMSGIININSGFTSEFQFDTGIFENGHSLNYSNSFRIKSGLVGIKTGKLKVHQKINWIETGNYNPVLSSHKEFDWFTSGLEQRYISPWINLNINNYQVSGTALFTENNRIHSSKIYGPEYHPEIKDGLNLIGLSYKSEKFKSNYSYKKQWINYKSESSYTPPVDAHHQLEIHKIDNEFLSQNYSFTNRNILTKSHSNSTNPADTSSYQSHFGFTFRNFNKLINLHFTGRTVLENRLKPIHSYEIILTRFIGNKFQFSGIYSRNFKKPNFNDLYWKPFGNAKLKTEISDNFYFNSEIDFHPVKLNFLSHFITYQNMIIWLQKPGNQDYWSPDNIESTISSGHTFVLSIKDFKNINSTFSISKNSTINQNTKSQIAYTPKWILNWNSNMKISKMKLGFNYNYQSSRFINYFSYDGKSRIIPAYSILNSSINYNFQLFKFQSSIELLTNNLLDTRFQSVYGYPEPGRSFELQLTINKREK